MRKLRKLELVVLTISLVLATTLLVLPVVSAYTDYDLMMGIRNAKSRIDSVYNKLVAVQNNVNSIITRLVTLQTGVTNIQNGIDNLQSTINTGTKTVAYNGIFILPAGTPSNLEPLVPIYIETVAVTGNQSAKFEVTITSSSTGASPFDFTPVDGDRLLGTFTWGVISQSLIYQEDNEIGTLVERSFVGHALEIWVVLADTLPYDVVISYSYVVTTSADATVLQIHGSV